MSEALSGASVASGRSQPPRKTREKPASSDGPQPFICGHERHVAIGPSTRGCRPLPGFRHSLNRDLCCDAVLRTRTPGGGIKYKPKHEQDAYGKERDGCRYSGQPVREVINDQHEEAECEKALDQPSSAMDTHRPCTVAAVLGSYPVRLPTCHWQSIPHLAWKESARATTSGRGVPRPIAARAGHSPAGGCDPALGAGVQCSAENVHHFGFERAHDVGDLHLVADGHPTRHLSAHKS